MGYNPPTNDPVAALKRKQEAAALAEREALSMGGTQPFQAVRKLQAQIAQLAATVTAQQGVIDFLREQTQYISMQSQVVEMGDQASIVYPFDPGTDVQMSVRTSSTGLLSITHGGHVRCVAGTGGTSSTGFVFEVVGVGVYEDSPAVLWAQSGGGYIQTMASVSISRVITLAPNADFTIRVRRQSHRRQGGDAGIMDVRSEWKTPFLQVTKVGM